MLGAGVLQRGFGDQDQGLRVAHGIALGEELILKCSHLPVGGGQRSGRLRKLSLKGSKGVVLGGEASPERLCAGHHLVWCGGESKGAHGRGSNPTLLDGVPGLRQDVAIPTGLSRFAVLP